MMHKIESIKKQLKEMNLYENVLIRTMQFMENYKT